jgi:carbonic anhydrase
MQKILNGLSKFQQEVYPSHESLFSDLASGQRPEVLFITCADSRIDPNLLTQSKPGELFICRNAGNIVPPFGESVGGVSATIEYAVMALDIEHIVVCGHSDCGAMRGLLHPEKVERMPAVSSWLRYGASARAVLEENYPHVEDPQRLRVLTEQNVLAQLDNLRTHPGVAARVRQGSVQLHGWYYDIPSGEVFAYDERARDFVPIHENRRRMSSERVA